MLPFAVWQSGFLFVITVRRPTHPLQGCVDCALWTYGRFFQLLRRTLKVACKKNPWSACYDLPNLCSKLCKINLSSRTRNQRLKMLDLKKLHPWSSRVSRFWRKYERHCLHFRDFFFGIFFNSLEYTCFPMFKVKSAILDLGHMTLIFMGVYFLTCSRPWCKKPQ